MSIPLPIIHPDQNSGIPGRSNGGYLYDGATEDTHLISKAWPLQANPMTQDYVPIAALTTYEHPEWPNEAEGGNPVYWNGLQVPQDNALFSGNAANDASDVDCVVSPWDGTGMSPYQMDLNIGGPVTGNQETMNGNTLQPNYVAPGQFGASTGGGTSAHETVTAYYMSQADQVVRDYKAAALFASS